ncbi:MAG: PAS domain S-box protein [Chloroflexaceae bacterium]|nr:PAS domain S-box protein [Chloroflexaceae bacterium]
MHAEDETRERGIAMTIDQEVYDALHLQNEALQQENTRLRQQIASLEQANHRVVDPQTDQPHIQELLQTQLLLQQILDNAPAMMFVKDKQGRYLVANRHHAALLERTPEAIVGKTDAELCIDSQTGLYVNTSPDEYRRHDQQVIDTGEPVSFEEIISLHDGPHTFLTTRFPLYDTQGTLYGVGGIAVDITERKRSEEILSRHDAILNVVGSMAEQFLQTPDLSHNIPSFLQTLTNLLQVHCGSFFEVHTSENGHVTAIQRYQYQQFGSSNNAQEPHEIDVSALDTSHQQWFAQLSKGQVIAGNSNDFPDTESHILSQQQIASVILVPVFVGTQWYGALRFDVCNVPRLWLPTEIDALRTAAALIGAAIHRSHVEGELQKFYLVVEQSASLIIMTDTDGKIEYVNPRFTEITGYTFEEVFEQNLRILKSNETPDSFYRDLWQQLTEGDQWSGEFRNRRKNGELFWAGATITPITDRENHMTNFLAIGQDITERKEAQEAMQNHLQFLETLLDTIPSPVFYHNPEGQLLGCNRLFASQVLGLPKDQLMHRSIYELSAFFHNDLAHVYAEQDQQLIEQAGMRVSETRVQCTDEHVRDFMFFRAVFKDASGTAAGIIGVMLDITERKRSEEALRKSEARFRTLAENARDMIFRYRLVPTRGFEYVSPSVRRITGYTQAEYYADPDIDLKNLHPKSRPVFDVFMNSAESYHEQIIMRYVHKNGRDVWLEQSHWQVVDEQGKAIAIEGISRDITERVEIEQALRIQHDLAVALSSENDLVSALNQVLTAVITIEEIDCGGVYLFDKSTGDMHLAVHTGFSPQFVEHIAYHPAQSSLVQMILENQTIYQRYSDVLLGPFDIDRWSEGLRSAIIVPVVEGSNVVAALSLASHTYDEIPISARTGIESIAAQIGGVIARVEAEVAMRESQNNLQTLFDTLDDFLFIFDTDGRILHVNPIMARRLGYTIDEMRTLRVVDIHSPDQRDHIISVLMGDADAPASPWMLPLRTRDGRQIPAETKATRGTWNKREVFFGIARDITERQRAQSQLIQQEQTLAAFRERERLARELHDSTGQVLGYVNTQSQTIKELINQGATAMAETHLTDLIAVTQDAQADVRQFILGVKASKGMKSFVASAEQGFFATLRQYLERVYTFYRLQTELIVAPDVTDNTFSPVVEVQLLRIIQEALNNVRKHAQATSVRVSFIIQDDRAQITIEDDGIGFDVDIISPDHGHNYGVHSMRERAEEVGGSLRIQASRGRGTRVIISMPLDRQENQLFKRVMLVDDHALFLEGMKNLLQSCGLDVIGTASDGFEAQSRVRELQPDVILMDIQMPNCNGLEATRLIKSEFPDIQIVMLTMSEEDEHLFEAIKSGASGYLLKSLDAGELFESLSMLARGEKPLTPRLASRMLEAFVQQQGAQEVSSNDQEKRPQDDRYEHPEEQDDGDEPINELTARQMEILSLVSQGMTYKQVGASLNLTERTIKFHMAEIIHRLHVANRAEAIAYAMRIKQERRSRSSANYS